MFSNCYASKRGTVMFMFVRFFVSVVQIHFIFVFFQRCLNSQGLFSFNVVQIHICRDSLLLAFSNSLFQLMSYPNCGFLGDRGVNSACLTAVCVHVFYVKSFVQIYALKHNVYIIMGTRTYIIITIPTISPLVTIQYYRKERTKGNKILRCIFKTMQSKTLYK